MFIGPAAAAPRRVSRLSGRNAISGEICTEGLSGLGAFPASSPWLGKTLVPIGTQAGVVIYSDAPSYQNLFFAHGAGFSPTTPGAPYTPFPPSMGDDPPLPPAPPPDVEPSGRPTIGTALGAALQKFLSRNEGYTNQVRVQTGYGSGSIVTRYIPAIRPHYYDWSVFNRENAVIALPNKANPGILYYPFSFQGRTYYYVPDTWSLFGGWAHFNPGQASSYGGVSIAMPWPATNGGISEHGSVFAIAPEKVLGSYQAPGSPITWVPGTGGSLKDVAKALAPIAIVAAFPLIVAGGVSAGLIAAPTGTGAAGGAAVATEAATTAATATETAATAAEAAPGFVMPGAEAAASSTGAIAADVAPAATTAAATSGASLTSSVVGAAQTVKSIVSTALTAKSAVSQLLAVAESHKQEAQAQAAVGNAPAVAANQAAGQVYSNAAQQIAAQSGITIAGQSVPLWALALGAIAIKLAFF